MSVAMMTKYVTGWYYLTLHDVNCKTLFQYDRMRPAGRSVVAILPATMKAQRVKWIV